MGRALIIIPLLTSLLHLTQAQNVALQIQEHTLQTSFRGIACGDGGQVWTSGENGTIGHSVDGGVTWQFIVVPGMENASFRDIEWCDDGSVVVMSATQPAAMIRSADGGQHFDITFSKMDSTWFLDGFDIHRNGWGLCYGDPIDGRMTLLETKDFGKSWTVLPTGPPVDPGTAAFAASGSGLHILSARKAIFITGGTASDLYQTKDRGRSWQKVSSTGLPSGPTSGAYGMAVSGKKIYVVGGDYTNENDTTGVFVFSENGGKTWKKPVVSPSGYRSGIAIGKNLIIVCGPTGVDYTNIQGGLVFKHWSDTAMHTLTNCEGVFYIAGPDGRTGHAFDTK